MDRFLNLKSGTTIKTEFIAGMTTFFAMVYILMVNAGGITGLTSVFCGDIRKD